MEYLQSFLIVVMETICFFLFQDAFISSKSGIKVEFMLYGFYVYLV